MSPEERAILIEEIKQAVTVPVHQLTPEEAQWVRMAIEAQAERAALRRAVIEKSLSSLIWAGLVGLGYMFVDFLHNHGFKF